MKKLVLVFAMLFMGMCLSSCTELEELEDSEPTTVLTTGENEDDLQPPGGGD